MLYLSNPNNPTGCLVNKGQMEEIVDNLPPNSFIILDEAFMDFARNSESFLNSGINNILVIRSLTKILAIPGLRIGFLHTNNDKILSLVDKIRQPWNVNIVAAEALSRLDKKILYDYIEKSIKLIETERMFLISELRRIGLEVYNSQAPFLLLRHPIEHPDMMEKLISYGVYVRDASSFAYLTKYHSRVSIRLREDNIKLITAFKNSLGIFHA